MLTPDALGYKFPAEFAEHEATWLSWPHKEASWPGKIDSIFPNYALFIKYLTQGEKVRINIANEAMKNFALMHLEKVGAESCANRILYASYKRCLVQRSWSCIFDQSRCGQ